jgi:small-conductance mechanosensitive channel
LVDFVRFDREIYFNPLRSWLLAILLSTAVYLVICLAKRILQNRAGKIEPSVAANWNDLAVEVIGSVHSLVFLLVAIYIGSLVLSLPETISKVIQKTVFLILLLQIGLTGSRTIRSLMGCYRQRKIDSNADAVTTLSSAAFVLRMLLWAIILLVALDNLGVNVTTLIAGLGISGIAIALAVQNILGDLFSSFSIVLDKPFIIGDFIIVDEYLGTVEYVGIKTTRIRSLSGEQLIFSNSDLLKSRIRNFKRMFERRVVFSISVEYGTSHENLVKIPNIIREIVLTQDKVRFDRAHFKEYGLYSLNFEIVYWIQNPDYNVYMDTQQNINLAIFEKFNREGIQFAYPTQTVLLQDEYPGIQN